MQKHFRDPETPGSSTRHTLGFREKIENAQSLATASPGDFALDVDDERFWQLQQVFPTIDLLIENAHMRTTSLRARVAARHTTVKGVHGAEQDTSFKVSNPRTSRHLCLAFSGFVWYEDTSWMCFMCVSGFDMKAACLSYTPCRMLLARVLRLLACADVALGRRSAGARMLMRNARFRLLKNLKRAFLFLVNQKHVCLIFIITHVEGPQIERKTLRNALFFACPCCGCVVAVL